MMATGLLMTSWLVSLAIAGQYQMVLEESYTATANSVLGYIALEDVMHFEMDAVVNSFPSSTWENFFHCGSADSIRMPGIWLHPSSNTNGFRMHVPSEPGWVGGALVIGETYHIEIDYTQSLLSVTINGESVYSAAKSQHTTYDSMIVYGSDPWYGAADVTVSNLVIWSGDEPTTTESPTDCSAVHIDEFLVDCSTEFSGHDADIVDLQEDVLALKVAVSDLANSTTTSEAIEAINAELAVISEQLDKIGDYDSSSETTGAVPLVLAGKDLVIIGMLTVNFVATVALLLSCRKPSGGRDKVRFSKVQVDSATDDEAVAMM